MAVDVRTEIVIGLPRDQVAEYAIAPSHAPEWYADIESVEWETPARDRRRVAQTRSATSPSPSRPVTTGSTGSARTCRCTPIRKAIGTLRNP